MKHKRWIALVTALVLAALGGGVALADNGDKRDPLVTQSYLEETALPDVVDQLEDLAKEREKELEKALEDQIKAYKAEMTALADSLTADQGTGTASFTLVTLSSGQTMGLDVGCEVLLRVGSATVTCGTNPALIDLSTGGTLNKDVALEKNHLYLSTIPDRVLLPGAETVKVLVRGGYTVI